MLGHLQIHKKGYLASIDSLPLNKNIEEKQMAKITEILDAEETVESYTLRIKLGAMFSNYAETTNIRLNAVLPEMELAAMPLLGDRVIKGDKQGLLNKGEILLPELIAKGMQVKEFVLIGCNAVNVSNVQL